MPANRPANSGHVCERELDFLDLVNPGVQRQAEIDRLLDLLDVDDRDFIQRVYGLGDHADAGPMNFRELAPIYGVTLVSLHHRHQRIMVRIRSEARA